MTPIDLKNFRPSEDERGAMRLLVALEFVGSVIAGLLLIPVIYALCLVVMG